MLGLGIVASVINALTEFYENNKQLKRVLHLCFATGSKKCETDEIDAPSTAAEEDESDLYDMEEMKYNITGVRYIARKQSFCDDIIVTNEDVK